MIQEHRFNTGEVELNYAKGPENGPPLVLLHGVTARWQDFLTVMPYLVQRHTVYAVDHRGHGRSGRVPGRYRGIDYGEDVRAFIEGVIGEPPIVHGHSLGGLAAVYLAANYPALVRALILEEPPLWNTTPDWVLDYFGECRELASLGKTAAELCEILQAQNTWHRTRALWLSQLDPGTVAAVIDKSIYEGYETEVLLKRISCPVLLIYGDPAKGSILTQEQADAIRTSIPDCVADFVDAGHLLHAQQPMQTVILLLGFLESL